MTKTTTGTATINAKTTYTGGTTISAGTLRLGTSEALADSGAITVAGGMFDPCTLDIGTNTETVGVVTLTNGSIIGTNGTLIGTSYDVRSGSISTRLSGPTASLTKTTTDAVTITGNHNYGGGTFVQAGKLTMGGTFTGGDYGSGGISVASGAILATIGTAEIVNGLDADITVAGTLAPGDIGQQGLFYLVLQGSGKLNFLPGSTLDFDLGDQTDLILFTPIGDWLAGSGHLTLALNGLTDYTQTYKIFQNTTTADFTVAVITGYDTANYTASFSQVGNDYVVNFSSTATPEPSSMVSLLGGIGVLAGLRRVRRSRD